MVKFYTTLDNPTYPRFGFSGIAVALSYCACCLDAAE